MSNNKNSILKIPFDRKIKKLDLQSISKSNKLDNNYMYSSSKKSEYTSKDISENKNDLFYTEQDVKFFILYIFRLILII